MAEQQAIDELTEASSTTKIVKRKKPSEEKKAEMKKWKRERDRTRVYIGATIGRWKLLKAAKGFRTDEALSLFLLDSYETQRDLPMYISTPVSTPHKAQQKRPPPTTFTSPERDVGDLSDVQPLEEPSPPVETAIYQLEVSMSSVDLNETINVGEFNSLHNATIECEDEEWEDEDWLPEIEHMPLSSSEEDVTREYDSEDEDSDDDYMPSSRLCVCSGGALGRKVNISAIQEISLDESVHGGGSDGEELQESNPDPDVNPVQSVDAIIGKPASIAYHISLMELVDHLQLPQQVCTAFNEQSMDICGSPRPFQVKITSRGTAAIIQWICARGHTVWKWTSQPILPYGMQVGDFLLASNILLSGNNYSKIALLLKFMNMGMVNRTTFYRIQEHCCIDTIHTFWNTARREIISGLQTKDQVVALGDARMDSPGFSAQFCTYTTMENDSKAIISVVNMDKRETARNSVIMEREAFIRTFDMLKEEVRLSEFCTDANVQIAPLFAKGKYKDSGVRHSLDMWHGSKNLGKKITAAGQQKDCTILNDWKGDICNHFWYCCRVADDYDTFFDMWSGVLHHVIGEHTWLTGTGGCVHHPLTDNRAKPWIQQDSKAHQRLREIVLDERWLKNVHKFLTFRSTAELESFHNHILMYASKRFGFSPPAYSARILLAALDYNHHLGLQPKPRADGQLRYRKKYNKKSRKWTLMTVKEEKDYNYIPALQRAILQEKLRLGGLPKIGLKRAWDCRALGPLSGVPAPSTEELLQTQASRGIGQSLPPRQQAGLQD